MASLQMLKSTYRKRFPELLPIDGFLYFHGTVSLIPDKPEWRTEKNEHEKEARIGILSEQMSEHADREFFASISTAYAQFILPGVNT